MEDDERVQRALFLLTIGGRATQAVSATADAVKIRSPLMSEGNYKRVRHAEQCQISVTHEGHFLGQSRFLSAQCTCHFDNLHRPAALALYVQLSRSRRDLRCVDDDPGKANKGRQGVCLERCQHTESRSQTASECRER